MGALSYGTIPVRVDEMRPEDWPTICAIYQEGIATRNATFEKVAPDWTQWDTSHLDAPRLVARIEEEVAGWAALSPISRRSVYAGVAEVSIYVASKAWNRGIGSMLLNALVQAAENDGFWTLQAGIFPENAVSIKIHGRAGFRVVGTRERLGCMDGTWRDVVLMERRSSRVGGKEDLLC
jgi:phosphinothricin acetyltransferase